MYKLNMHPILFKVCNVIRLSDNACIPLDPANTDFANFKKDLANGDELQDAEGNTMTTEQINEFIKELP
jgi:hypothetical protein